MTVTDSKAVQYSLLVTIAQRLPENLEVTLKSDRLQAGATIIFEALHGHTSELHGGV